MNSQFIEMLQENHMVNHYLETDTECHFRTDMRSSSKWIINPAAVRLDSSFMSSRSAGLGPELLASVSDRNFGSTSSFKLRWNSTNSFMCVRVKRAWFLTPCSLRVQREEPWYVYIYIHMHIIMISCIYEDHWRSRYRYSISIDALEMISSPIWSLKNPMDYQWGHLDSPSFMHPWRAWAAIGTAIGRLGQGEDLVKMLAHGLAGVTWMMWLEIYMEICMNIFTSLDWFQGEFRGKPWRTPIFQGENDGFM